jgi:threonine/homoserine/homoserine lactone efflux protein
LFDSQVVAFTLVAAVLTITPGADTMLVLRNTLRGGRAFGWSTALGIATGCLLHAALSAVGLSMILARSAAAFHAVKLLGAGYLIWLGAQSLLARDGVDVPAGGGGEGAPPPPRWRGFLDGFATNLLNPKVAVFYLAFLPQFISAGDPVLAKSLLLAGIHDVLGLAWLGTIAVLVARGRRWIRRPSIRRALSRFAGVTLAALGVRLALERRG